MKYIISKYDDIAETLIDILEMVAIMAITVGLAPMLMWLSTWGI
tara:strand:+ start:517 stop:648 length:132 start_codon:yes stop_codon:yes gene_type:complete